MPSSLRPSKNVPSIVCDTVNEKKIHNNSHFLHRSSWKDYVHNLQNFKNRKKMSILHVHMLLTHYVNYKISSWNPEILVLHKSIKDLKNPYWILLYRKEKKKQANWSEPIKKWHNFFSLSKIWGLILCWYTYFVQITNVKSLQMWNRFCFGLQNNFRFGNVTKYIVNQQRIGCQILAWLKKIWICLIFL